MRRGSDPREMLGYVLLYTLVVLVLVIFVVARACGGANA